MKSLMFALLIAVPLWAQAETLSKYSVLEQGSRSGIQMQRFDTLRKESTFRAFWQNHHRNESPLPPLPEVDFSKEMVIAAFVGQKSTGGYRLNVIGLNRHGGQIELKLSLTQPGPDCLVTDAATQPYVIIKLKKSSRPVSFQMISKTFSCVTGESIMMRNSQIAEAQ